MYIEIKKTNFDVFCVTCYAADISAYGLDVIKISEKQRKRGDIQ